MSTPPAFPPRLMAVALALLVHALGAQDQPVVAAAVTKSATRPAWATDFGKDQSGTWADLAVEQSLLRLRWIPPGAFTMGSPKGEADRDVDEAQHQVTLSRGYWLADSEISRQFWQAVMGSNPNGGDGALPVGVSWEEGQKFFTTLNQLKPGLAADFPSEAQWEYACRAGTSGPTYAPVDAAAWYIVTSADAYGNNPVKPPKQKQANAWGLYDMLGNVWESTRDWYGEYPGGAVTDPPGPPTGNRHVVRGGSSRNAAGCCRAAWRWAEFPPAKGFGIRLMAPASP